MSGHAVQTPVNYATVIDPKNCFLGVAQEAALAGSYSAGQLYNPLGSAIKIIVTRIWMSVTVTGAIYIRKSNAALATLASAENAYIFGPAGLGEVRRGTSVAAIGSALGRMDVLANTPVDLIQRPLVLTAERAVVIYGAVNCGIVVQFEWMEKAL